MTENLLQAGVTKPCLDPTLRSTWLAAVHESVRDQSISFISDVEDPAVGRNYYRVNVQLRHGEPFSLLLNAFANLVAAAIPADENTMVLTFTEVPQEEAFFRAGFRVMTPSELNVALTAEHLRELAEDERRDVAYHRPDRIGDLLFNWFD